MKKLLPLITLLLVTLTGCVSTSGNRVEDIAPALEVAAYTGTIIAVQEHPEWRPHFVLAHQELAALEFSEGLNLNKVLDIVNRLPIKELKSKEATIVITSGRLLLARYNRNLVVDADTMANILTITSALRAGLGEALTQTDPVVLTSTISQ